MAIVNPGASVEAPIRKCGMCEHTEYEHWWRKDGYDIGKCRKCGLVQVLQDVPDQALADLYDESYFKGGSACVYQDYLADPAAKRAYFGNKFDEIFRDTKLMPPGHCLEIGCAYGLFLAEARQRGWRVRGVEVSEASAQWARTHLNLDVDSSPTALQNISSETYELVAMWDVIEHLKHPLEVLRHARRALRPGGLIVLSTGDVGSLGARIYGSRWRLISPPYHQFYFDRVTIGRMLELAGFNVMAIHGEGHPLDNWGHPRFLSWLAKRERYIGWRFDSGPIMNVTAKAS